jgi:signal transduction histidine kinase
LLRHQSAFGLYDLFLIDAPSGRVLYTVLKETDLGASLVEPPFHDTALARVYRRALEPSASANPVVIEDFTLYPASGIPAAFLAAPIFRAGAAVGVLVIQVSIDELNRVMTGDRQWRAAGLGDTGQTYIVGYDGRFRSDVREQLERPVEFLEHLRVSVDAATVESVRHDRTEVIHLKVPDDALAQIQSRRTETSLGRDFFGRPVLRSQTPLRVPGLDWMVVAELSVDEAFAPVSALRTRMLKVSGALALLFFATASIFSRKVTGPLRDLTLAARKVGTRAFNTRVAVLTGDELGQLAATFNDMAECLERTTVSREQLEWLAGRLMASQEEERARIARELHDDFAQRFAALSMDLATLERTTDTDARQSLGQRIKTSVATLSNDLRQLSRLLHPSILDDLGLVAAIESECRLTGERGLVVHFEHEGDIEGLSKEAQLTLYRIIQEGLHNTMRHAHARSATVRLRRNNCVHLELHDDGQGFLREDPGWTPGLGLLSMEERTRLLGGQLKISSAPGLGTHLVVELPR